MTILKRILRIVEAVFQFSRIPNRIKSAFTICVCRKCGARFSVIEANVGWDFCAECVDERKP